MADHTVEVIIVTPDGSVYDRDDATMVIVKTGGGEMGILASHQPFVATLEIDAVRIQTGDKEDQVAVCGGFIEFSGNLATIVADSAETSKEIDIERAQNAKSRAEEHIKHAHEVHDAYELSRAEVALKRAVNRLNISGK